MKIIKPDLSTSETLQERAKQYWLVERDDGTLRCSCGRPLVKLDEESYQCIGGYPVYRMDKGEVMVDTYGRLLLKRIPHSEKNKEIAKKME